jgi:hypothetical protein
VGEAFKVAVADMQARQVSQSGSRAMPLEIFADVALFRIRKPARLRLSLMHREFCEMPLEISADVDKSRTLKRELARSRFSSVNFLPIFGV